MFENEQYGYMKKMTLLYDRLQDELSKDIFWARLKYDTTQGIEQAIQLQEIGCGRNAIWRNQLTMASEDGKKIVLYGAGGSGMRMAEMIMHNYIDFYAFCDRNRAGEIVLGKPVLSPEELVNSPEQYAVVITTASYYKEIYQFLQENAFPMAYVLRGFGVGGTISEAEQYREFPELFKLGTAIVDAGCFDGEDTIQFSKWCKGNYSKIYAFEPDKVNYDRCKANIEAAKVPNVILSQAGLDKFSGKKDFCSLGGIGSYLVETAKMKNAIPWMTSTSKNDSVQVYALDDLADVEIGLIKMDIEGAEFDALHGAKEVIRRDKPHLAICVYHRQGDMLAIMEYLYDLVPEYRFWLRHYGLLEFETVLYAAV